MPEDAQIAQSLVELLNEIEDPEFDKKSKSIKLKSLLGVLQTGKVPTPDDVVKILKICTDTDISCLVYEVAIIKVIVKNDELIKTIDTKYLTDSALFLIRLLRSVFFTPNTLMLRSMTLQTFLSYPIFVHFNIVTNHGNEILDTMNADNGTLDIEHKVEICHLLKVLDTLSSCKAKLFVKQGLNIWLSKLIPQTMAYMAIENDDNKKLVYVQYLETLTDILVTIDYFDNVHWKFILECICNTIKRLSGKDYPELIMALMGFIPKKLKMGPYGNEQEKMPLSVSLFAREISVTRMYPSIIKKLLEQGSMVWHRLWIIIIKLLNVHITKNIGGLGTPINSMLPVVETAFKMDAEQRIRAFQCWNKLIDNFSKETNENCIAKRIKLLVIPLKLNNAKTEDIAIAKFDTWWHLIRKFDNKSERFNNDVLMPFIHFIFGKSGNAKPSFTATQLSNKLKRKSLEAFVEIVGHDVDCECSLEIPKLNSKKLNIKLLISNWNDWKHFIDSAYKLAGNVAIYELSTKNYMKCVLKTIVQLIASLADNNIRRDLFTEMLTLLLNMLKDPKTKVQLQDVIVTALMSALFGRSDQTKDLLKTKSEEYKPLALITATLVDSSLNNYYERFTETQLIQMFKPIALLVLREIISNEKFCIFDSLKPNDTLLKFWVAIMENVPDVGDIDPEFLLSMMEWPLMKLDSFKEVKVAAMKWYTICNLMYKRLSTTGFNREISQYIVPKGDSLNYFIICVTIGVMKQRLLNGESPGAMSTLLKKFTSSIDHYEEYEELIPLIVDTLALMISTTENDNVDFAKDAKICVKDLLKVLISAIDKKDNNNESSDTLFIQLNNLKKVIDSLMKIKAYTDYALEIINELSSHLTKVKNNSPIYKTIISMLKSYTVTVDDSIKSKIIETILATPNGNNFIEQNSKNNIMEIAVVKEFTSPDIKKVKKAKKIEPNIVNKVVENGEEYVVVKSNWKFNPKKLTENQREKLQRKREDIPALYQDLSQSQDEFKLSTWKTDSQDTTTTSSNSKSTSKTMTADDTTAILKTIPSIDVVPKIMENILHNHDQKVGEPQNGDKGSLPEKNNKKTALTPTPNNTKSPRLALKDRVFRNMKNLLEKQTPPKDKPDIDPRIHTENVPTTPTIKRQADNNVLNSAPPVLIVDRPSRVKRKPKKFDDSELFALRKRRHSQSGGLPNDSQDDSQKDKGSVNDLKSEQTVEVSENKKVQNINKIVEGDMIEGIKPLNTKDDVVEKHPTENIKDSTNEVTLKKSSEKRETVDEVDHKVPEVDLTASLVEKEPSQAPVIDTLVVTESEPLIQPKKPLETVAEEKVEENIVTTKTNTQSNADVENIIDLPATPAPKGKGTVPPKSTTKKSTKKSRIEKELAIDMVEGHPLFKMKSQKRTRKKIVENLLTPKRKSITDKLNKSKSEATPKSSKKSKEKTNTQMSVTVEETQERSHSPEDVIQVEPPCSEDVIESSQDSAITTISVKPTKRTPKRKAVVTLERLSLEKTNEIQGLLQDSEIVLEQNKTDVENREDSVFPQNKTIEDNDQTVLTENMDTEPIVDKDISDDVIIINEKEESPLTIHSEVVVGPETQKIAEAETQPNNSVDFMEFETTDVHKKDVIVTVDIDLTQDDPQERNDTVSEVDLKKDTIVQSDSVTDPDLTKDLTSPYKDEDQRKQDFLNNTVEISPIKIQSPDRDKTPSPETSSDFVVIILSSPVHINGEPYEKPGSPEFFTNDKISPDKRDVSPPRTEVITANNTSPSSSLSLKKNKPQVRPSGRAAHMLGLCVPDKLNTIKMPERFELDEGKKASTPARRNLRILYNTVGDNNNTESSESEESENFLKLQRSLPAVDCSPVGPILKRKLSEITDDATISPASKRKRVSFHDPPVSTTVSVHKYIEPTGLRSPQNSAQKRLERQSRQPYSKSPKRLDNVFKLETVLSKAVESFAEEPAPIQTPDETQTSLEVTPAMEIIKTSELNDSDPICPDLVSCVDHISVIAAELSSPSLKHLFVKQIEDKIKTVGDLAKMTEVEICRLCIKAPKVKVAKKVLTDYSSKLKETAQVETVNTPIIENIDVPITEAQIDNDVSINTSNVESQTDEVSQCDMEVQTVIEPVVVSSTQTDTASVTCSSVQTDESGCRSTTDVINTCLAERNDFVEKLGDVLDMTTITKISSKLPYSTVFEMLTQKHKSTEIFDKILEKECCDVTKEGQRRKELAFFTEYMSQRFDSRDLILFCSQLLQKVHDKST